MTLFTICATDRERLARPCAVVEAVSAAEAMRQADGLRRSAEIGFVPGAAHLTARRSSRREARAYRSFMAPRPELVAPTSDPGFTWRAQRRAIAFFQKLWLGEIDLATS